MCVYDRSKADAIGQENRVPAKHNSQEHIILEVRDTAHRERLLIELSGRGGAWVSSVNCFSHTTHFYRYQNPSSVPDWYIEHAGYEGRRIGWQGKLTDFTRAAKIREELRGYNGD